MTRVLLDCRWLSRGGAGTLTAFLLKGLAQEPPAEEWVLWGDREIEPLAWSGAEVAVTSTHPIAMWGQRGWLQLPACDLAVFMHQVRPLRPVPSVTVVLDTIALRNARSRLERQVKGWFLRRVAAMAREIVTISEHSKMSIVRDLGVPADRVTVLSIPIDEEFAEQVERRRRTVPPADVALFVGAFTRNKNLPMLVRVFERTRFFAEGGQLVVVGGSVPQVRALTSQVPSTAAHAVHVRGRCSQDELYDLFASSLFLVQPSLEEGFGLPVREALSCGLPVCVSDGGALPEITRGLAEPFPAASEEAMAAAIDASADRARRVRAEQGFRPRSSAELGAPSAVTFAKELRRIVNRNLT
ncbi:MAG: glycosyltransferase [Actinomycetota bacterium]|nr:glycosyltransferase [Actinomycetota bacterium]